MSGFFSNKLSVKKQMSAKLSIINIWPNYFDIKTPRPGESNMTALKNIIGILSLKI